MSAKEITVEHNALGSSGSDLTRLPSEGVVQQRARKKPVYTDETFLDAPPVERARMLLEQTRRAPGMFATCREALIMRVTSIMEMAGVPKNREEVIGFYRRHDCLDGNMYVHLNYPVIDEWAHALIDDALGML